MKKNIFSRYSTAFFAATLMLTTPISQGCKSEFEKIRTSGDAALLLKKADEYYGKKDFIKSQILYELVMPSYRGRPELEKMSYRYSYTHYHQKSYTSAEYYFKNYGNTFPTSTFREEVDFMAAYCHYKLSPTHRLDQDNSQKAIDGLQTFANTYPRSERVKQCNTLINELRKKLEQKAFEEGKLYYDIRQYQASTQSFENLLKDYPETADAEEIRYLILRGNYELASNSVYDKQLERFRNVVSKYEDFKNKFPRSKFQKEADLYLKASNQKIEELSNVRHQNPSSKS
jgi:outer membrane protein assembly factor BamD